VEIGAYIPNIVPEPLDRKTFLAWCRRIDEGPFAWLGYGERTAWNTLDHGAAMAAAAVTTERVRLMSATMNVPIHPTAVAAKKIATLDVLADGRYAVVIGTGGSKHDWRTSDRAYTKHPHARIDRQVEEMRAIWRGEPPYEGAPLVLPQPVQPGGPPLYSSARGPKGLARAARWADGYAGFVGAWSSTPELAREYLFADANRIRDAWRAAGRTDEPYLSTSCFYVLGPRAKETMREVAGGYQRVHQPHVTGDEFWVHNPDAVLQIAEIAEAAGFDNLFFVPATGNVGVLDELCAALGERKAA
jgi:alkanesulfonate monooxygenase SsuD/methylene tetrahydromethanopterin reductase-like flavin-dependent oxidoreductase (luciferase family)